MANELLPLPKGASYESPTDSLPLLPKGASYEAPTGDLLPLPKGASYEAPPPPVVNNPRQFPETSMRTNVGNLIAKKYNQEVPIIDNPALQNMGIKTGAPTDADIIAQLAGPSTDNSKADIARYTLAKQNLETAKQKAQQSFKSGASQEQANEIYSKALGPISTVTPSATSWEKPEDISFAPGATGLADTWQAAKATGIALKRGAAKGEAGLSQAAGGQLRFAQDMVGMDTAGTVSTLDAIDKRVSEIGDSSSHPVQLFEGAISSIIQEIPAIAGSLLTGTAGFALTSMFANSFGQTYDDSRRKGLDVADSTMRSGAYASLEVLGEKFGLGDTLKGIKAAAKGVPAEDLTSFFAKALAKEIPGEQLTYAGQFAVDKGYELNPEAGIKAFLDGAIDTLGATVIQGGLMLGGGHVTNKAMNSIATKMPTLFARTIEAQQTQQAEQSAEAAKQSALDKWKALSATSKPAQAQPQEQAQPQQEVEAPQYADLVKQYMAQGQTKDNAILLVDQDIADQKEADNARGTITTPVGTSPEISGQPAGTQTAEGTEPYIGPTVDGAGVTTTPVESGTVQQQNPLVQAMHESGADFKNPSQVKKFVAQVAPEQVASLIEADPKAFKALLEEWKTTQPEAVQEQVAPVAEEVLTEEEPVLGYEEMLRASEQEAAATQEAEEPHVAEGRKLATQLKQVDPYNNFDFLKDPNVTPEEVAQAKDTLAEYTGKKEVPKATEESERTATIDEINASLGQLHSPEQLQANPPTVVNDYEDLPEGIKQQAQEGGASAFIDPATGKDYYVASQIPSNKIKGKILHERGAHIGLTRLIGGPRLQKLANQVLEWAKGGDALENTIAKEAAHWADYSGEEAGSERYNQEVVAYFTEIAVDDYGIDPLQDQPTGKQKVLSWLSELWQGVIEAIQKLNIDPSTLSAQDIVKMVQGAARLGTSPRESIEAKGVFTPKMMGELMNITADSPLVTSEIYKTHESMESPPIQASARDLNNALGYTKPGIDKTFTELFYDELKNNPEFKSAGSKEEGVNIFVAGKMYAPERPVKAIVSPERVLAQLPPMTIYNLEYRKGDDWTTRQVYRDPHAAAKKYSEATNNYRDQFFNSAARAVDTSVDAMILQSLQLNVTDLSEFNMLQKGKILIKHALAKYAMAGDKLLSITEKNEYLPLNGEDITQPFIDYMLTELMEGKTPKQALNNAFMSTIFPLREQVITNQLGDSWTGWLKFSGQDSAQNLRLVTADTGSEPGSWCVGRGTNFGKNYLSSSDFSVYVDKGKSLVASLDDLSSGYPKEWFGLGASQKVLPQHQYLLDEHPNASAAPEPEPLTAEEQENKNAEDAKKAEEKQVADTAQQILTKAAIGDVRALSYVFNSVVNPKYSDTVSRVVSKYTTEFDTSYSVNKVTGFNHAMNTALTNKAEEAKNIEVSMSFGDLFPQLKSVADSDGQLHFNTNGVVITPLVFAPKEITDPIDALIKEHHLQVPSAPNIIKSAVKKAGDVVADKYNITNALSRKVRETLSTAFDEECNRLQGIGVPSDDIYTLKDTFRKARNEAVDPLHNWIMGAPSVKLQGTFNIDADIQGNKYNTLVVYHEQNSPSTRGVDSEYDTYAMLLEAARTHKLNPDGFNIYSELRAKEKELQKDIRDSFISEVRALIPEDKLVDKPKDYIAEVENIPVDITDISELLGTPTEEAPRILASKKGKVDKILLKIERSESAEGIGNALNELMEAGTWEDKKHVLRASFDALSSKGISNLLPALTTSQITDWVGDKIPHLTQVTRNVEKMSVMRSKMLGAITDTVGPWVDYAKSDVSGAKNLSRIMHYSTLGEVDPSLYPNIADALKNDSILKVTRKKMDTASGVREKAAYKGQITSRTRTLTQAYKMWNELNAKGKELYLKVRDHYKNTFNLHRAILDDRIAKSNVPGDIADASTPKGKLMAAIRSTYEDAKNIGVYFPLLRYGDFWLSYGKGVDREFYMYESETQRNLFLHKRIEQLQKAGDTRSYDDIMDSGEFDAGNEVAKLRDASTESSEMLKGIFNVIETTGVQDKEALKDSVYQMYLMTMPEQSFRKQFIHRKGIAGFSGDALRNFVRSGYTAANQLSRHKFGPDISLEMDSAHKALEGMPPKEKVKLGIFLGEITKRVGEELAPVVEDQTLARIANGANQAAFLWRLTSPKSAIANMTAIPVFGLPILASRYGEINAAATLAKYGNVFNHTTFVTPDGKYTPLSVGMSKHVQSNKIYAAAFEEAAERGVTEITRTYDLLAMAKTPSTAHQGTMSRGVRAGVNMAGILFHHSERLNREIMFMASFELAYKKATKEGLVGGINGEAFNRAIDEAVKNTYDSMFNYTKYNRPSIMRSPAARVVFQFKLFPQQVTAYLLRNFWTMLKGSKLNPRARREATTQLLGTLLMGGLFAGIVGMPLYSMILGALQGLLKALEDKDDPIPIEERDLDLWFRMVYLPEHFGAAAKYIEKGPISVATNLDIGSSTSFNNLWFRDGKYDASMATEFTDFVINAAGPSIGLGIDTLKAYDDFRSGHFNQGVEKLLPAFAKGAFTQYVWGKEGVKVKGSQADIIDKYEVTKAERFWKAFGFNPTELTRIQEANYPAQELVQRALDEKKKIISRLNLEFSQENDAGFEKALQDAVQFTIANPEMPILGDTIAKSLLDKAKLRAMADHGLVVPAKLMPRLYELVKHSRPEESATAMQKKFDARMKEAEKPVIEDEEEEE